MQNGMITGYEVTHKVRDGDKHLFYKVDKDEAERIATRLSLENIHHEFRVFPCYNNKEKATFGEPSCFRSRFGYPTC